MSKKLIILILIMNLVGIGFWGYSTLDTAQAKKLAKTLLAENLTGEGQIQDIKNYAVSMKSGSISKTVIDYGFEVNNKHYVGTITLRDKSGAAKNMSAYPLNASITILYNFDNPDINLPFPIAQAHSKLTPWNLKNLFLIILMINGSIIFLSFIAKRYENEN